MARLPRGAVFSAVVLASEGHAELGGGGAEVDLLFGSIEAEAVAQVEGDSAIVAAEDPKGDGGVGFEALHGGVHQGVADALLLVFLKEVDAEDLAAVLGVLVAALSVSAEADDTVAVLGDEGVVGEAFGHGKAFFGGDIGKIAGIHEVFIRLLPGLIMYLGLAIDFGGGLHRFYCDLGGHGALLFLWDVNFDWLCHTK